MENTRGEVFTTSLGQLPAWEGVAHIPTSTATRFSAGGTAEKDGGCGLTNKNIKEEKKNESLLRTEESISQFR